MRGQGNLGKQLCWASLQKGSVDVYLPEWESQGGTVEAAPMGMPPTTAGAIDDLKKLKMGATPRDKTSLPFVQCWLAGRFSATPYHWLLSLRLLLPFFPCFCDGHMASHFRFTLGFARFTHIFGFQMEFGRALRTPESNPGRFCTPYDAPFWLMGKRMVPAPKRTPAPTNPHRFTPPTGEFWRTRRVSITQKGVDDAPVRFFFPRRTVSAKGKR